MNKTVVACLLFAGLVAGADKKMKPWTEWSEKEVQKMLDNSPWGQTQVETNTAEMFYSPTAPGGRAPDRAAQGATNQATSVSFYIRFLTAKPIRQAFARRMELQQKSTNPQLVEQLRQFAERQTDEWVVVAVAFDSKDSRFSGPVMQTFNSANTGLLKNNTYLEVRGDGRNFLEEYRAPAPDGMGAKFVFKRMVNGEAFIRPDRGEVRFYSEFSPSLKLNMRFKVSDMMYEGQLEY